MKRIVAIIFLCQLLMMASCSESLLPDRSRTGSEMLKVDSLNAPAGDSTALAIIAPYKVQIDSGMNVVIGYSDLMMAKDQPCGTLNNFVADLVLEMGNRLLKLRGVEAAVCLLNYGGLRNIIPAGQVTLGNIYELMPFDNTLVALQLDSSAMQQMFLYLAREGGMPVSGMRLGISSDTVKRVTVQGKPFEAGRIYWVITSDYLASGGDNMNFLLNPVASLELNVAVRDVIVEYIRDQTRAGRTLNAVNDHRIYYE